MSTVNTSIPTTTTIDSDGNRAAPDAVATSTVALAGMGPAFVSGAVAGMVADSMLHPLDTINLRMKVRTQASAAYAGMLRTALTIARTEGIRGYFSGLSTTMLFSPVCMSVYFGTYETLKGMALPLVTLDGSAHSERAGLVYFVAGAASKVIISAISVPAEVVKSRLQLGRNPSMASGGMIQYTQNYRGTAHAFASIMRSEGVRGLYAGYTACLSVETFFSAFSFLFYESLKNRYSAYVARQEQTERPLTTSESLVLGSLAGGGAAFLTNPLDVMTVRLMTQGKRRHYAGLLDCLQKTVGGEGVAALWKGAGCRTAAITPQMGVCFGVFETIKNWWFAGELDGLDLGP